MVSSRSDWTDGLLRPHMDKHANCSLGTHVYNSLSFLGEPESRTSLQSRERVSFRKWLANGKGLLSSYDQATILFYCPHSWSPIRGPARPKTPTTAPSASTHRTGMLASSDGDVPVATPSIKDVSHVASIVSTTTSPVPRCVGPGPRRGPGCRGRPCRGLRGCRMSPAASTWACHCRWGASAQLWRRPSTIPRRTHSFPSRGAGGCFATGSPATGSLTASH